MRRAIVLLSGGLDSATCLVIARRDGFEAHALSFDYGQRHRLELEVAARVAGLLKAASHRVVAMDLRSLGGSALTSDAIPVPKARTLAEIGHGIPSTYVPARNTVFLAVAFGAAEVLDADAVYLGVNALDYSGYPDCRPEFLDAMREVAIRGTKRGVEGHPLEIRAPLLRATKAEIATMAVAFGVPVAATLSCYDPAGSAVAPIHCGGCDACLLRKKGFAEAKLTDPTAYAA